MIAVLLALTVVQKTLAQQPTRAGRDSIVRADSLRKGMARMPSMAMSAADSSKIRKGPVMTEPLGVPMDRMGSGTTWIPDAVSLPSRHFAAGAWDFMLHGFVFVQVNSQGGARGAWQFGSLNWGMFMASHELKGGRFQARTMLSLDPATATNRGYPLLLQTGEAFDGQP